ncbi:MAG: hypothetical protein ACRED9_00155 [Caulobacteraceae bacterium]
MLTPGQTLAIHVLEGTEDGFDALASAALAASPVGKEAMLALTAADALVIGAPIAGAKGAISGDFR